MSANPDIEVTPCLDGARSVQGLVSLGFDSPLMALDRLNSWLRSAPRWSGRLQSQFREIIYWTKKQAILEVAKYTPIEIERLMTPVECRRCGGTGLWYSDFDVHSEHPEMCRGCNGTGLAKLRFICTTIGPIRWHTPREKWRSGSMDHYLGLPKGWCEADDLFGISDGWTVNKAGTPMTTAEVERDMLVVLRAYPKDVAFSIDFYHHAKIMPQYGCPDVRKGEAWVRSQCEANTDSTNR